MTEARIQDQPVFLFAEECDRGRVREENQDSVASLQTQIGHLMIVADGIGGYSGGAVASGLVVESICRVMAALPQNYPPDHAIRDACEAANRSILSAATAPDTAHPQMGSTVVVALIQHREDEISAWIGHAGDSRAYLQRDTQIRRLTRDHSVVQGLLNQNAISAEEAGKHPDVSLLTRSLGQQPEVEIDIEKVLLVPGDSLLLCSDGLWGFVPEEEIELVLADSGLAVQAATKTLLEMSLAAGGQDNIGIEMMRVCRPELAGTTYARQPSRTRPVTIVLLALLAVAIAAIAYFAF